MLFELCTIWLSHRFIKWTQETFQSGGHKGELLPLLERCTRELQTYPAYKNDVRYLRTWIQYVSNTPLSFLVLLIQGVPQSVNRKSLRPTTCCAGQLFTGAQGCFQLFEGAVPLHLPVALSLHGGESDIYTVQLLFAGAQHWAGLRHLLHRLCCLFGTTRQLRQGRSSLPEWSSEV
jgi:hypothetical protein